MCFEHIGTYRRSHRQKGRHRVKQQLLFNQLGQQDQDQRNNGNYRQQRVVGDRTRKQQSLIVEKALDDIQQEAPRMTDNVSER